MKLFITYELILNLTKGGLMVGNIFTTKFQNNTHTRNQAKKLNSLLLTYTIMFSYKLQQLFKP